MNCVYFFVAKSYALVGDAEPEALDGAAAPLAEARGLARRHFWRRPRL